LSSREIINLVQSIKVPLIGANLVEFNPLKDIDDMSAVLSAKLVNELAGKKLSSLPS
jgi:arginase